MRRDSAQLKGTLGKKRRGFLGEHNRFVEATIPTLKVRGVCQLPFRLSIKHGKAIA